MTRTQNACDLRVGLVGGVSLARLDQDLESSLQEFDGLDESQQVKHVYACHGLAMYFAQVFEEGLRNVLGICAGVIDGLTLEELDTYSSSFARNTLGQLMNKVKARVEVDPDAERVIRIALKKRNFLAHKFFARRIDFLCHPKGCRTLCIELLRSVQIFRLADLVFEPLVTVLLSEVGWAPERVEMLAKHMRKKAQVEFDADD